MVPSGRVVADVALSAEDERVAEVYVPPVAVEDPLEEDPMVPSGRVVLVVVLCAADERVAEVFLETVAPQAVKASRITAMPASRRTRYHPTLY